MSIQNIMNVCFAICITLLIYQNNELNKEIDSNQNVQQIMFKKPTVFSKPIAKIEKGRLLIIQNCDKEWCKAKTNNFKGWINKEYLWGAIN